MYLAFLLLWILFNGAFTVEILIFGIVISAAMMAFHCKFLDYSLSKELALYKNALRLLRYYVTLLKEIVKSNLAVMRFILTQKEEVEPVLVTFDTNLKKASTQALMANTITVTPGTITVLLEDGTYTVHCLDEDFAKGLEDSSFIQMLEKVEATK